MPAANCLLTFFHFGLMRSRRRPWQTVLRLELEQGLELHAQPDQAY